VQKHELIKEWRKRDLIDFLGFIRIFEGQNDNGLHINGLEINFLVDFEGISDVEVEADDLEFLVDRYLKNNEI
jgi:hypothetical protein